MSPYKHPALHGRQWRWRKARIIRQSMEHVPGTPIYEQNYEISFLDNVFDYRRTIGESRLRALSPLEMLADQAD